MVKINILFSLTWVDDIEVRFYEENPDGKIVWESFGNFQPSVDVHKQYAISFRTPQYRDLEVNHNDLEIIKIEKSN